MNKSQINRTINRGIPIIFVIASILFAMPSIIYWIQKGTTLNFAPYFHFLYDASVDRGTQTISYLILLTVLSIAYFAIIKRRKEIVRNLKEVLVGVAIISLIFVAVLPFTCSDIFYYLGIGRLDSTYHQNPYYTTIKEFVEQDNNQAYLRNRYRSSTRIQQRLGRFHRSLWTNLDFDLQSSCRNFFWKYRCSLITI